MGDLLLEEGRVEIDGFMQRWVDCRVVDQDVDLLDRETLECLLDDRFATVHVVQIRLDQDCRAAELFDLGGDLFRQRGAGVAAVDESESGAPSGQFDGDAGTDAAGSTRHDGDFVG